MVHQNVTILRRSICRILPPNHENPHWLLHPFRWAPRTCKNPEQSAGSNSIWTKWTSVSCDGHVTCTSSSCPLTSKHVKCRQVRLQKKWLLQSHWHWHDNKHVQKITVSTRLDWVHLIANSTHKLSWARESSKAQRPLWLPAFAEVWSWKRRNKEYCKSCSNKEEPKEAPFFIQYLRNYRLHHWHEFRSMKYHVFTLHETPLI